MNTKLTPFLFEGEIMVRVLDRDGAPWFMLTDVCRVLDVVNPTRAASRLDEDEKGLHTVKTLGGDQEVTIVSESGLYSLILTSRKPAARQFKKWVTSEVLPSIRRTGAYEAPYRMPEQPNLDDESEFSAPDGLKLRKVNTAIRCFGERVGRQMWVALGLEWVPAMASAMSQGDLLDNATPGSVTVTINPGSNGAH